MKRIYIIRYSIFVISFFSLFSCSRGNFNVLEEEYTEEYLNVKTDTPYIEIKKIIDLPTIGNHPNEGLAVYKHNAFVFGIGGICRIIDIPSRSIVKVLYLASANEKHHANNAIFSNTFFPSNNKYPLLYISECSVPNRCYVENFNGISFNLVQTIELTGSEYPEGANWILDNEKKFIYTIQSINQNRTFLIRKYNLPNINSNYFSLSIKDRLEEFSIKVNYLLQGGIIYGDKMYINYGYTNIKRGFIVIDLSTKEVRDFDISSFFSPEPEAFAIYGNSLIMDSNEPGGLYFSFHL